MKVSLLWELSRHLEQIILSYSCSVQIKHTVQHFLLVWTACKANCKLSESNKWRVPCTSLCLGHEQNGSGVTVLMNTITCDQTVSDRAAEQRWRTGTDTDNTLPLRNCCCISFPTTTPATWLLNSTTTFWSPICSALHKHQLNTLTWRAPVACALMSAPAIEPNLNTNRKTCTVAHNLPHRANSTQVDFWRLKKCPAVCWDADCTCKS